MLREKSAKAIKPLFTIRQTAEILQVSDKTVRRWIERRELEAYRLGRQWRVALPDIENFLKLRRQQ